MRILKCHMGLFASSTFIFYMKNSRKSTPKIEIPPNSKVSSKSGKSAIEKRQATSNIAVLESKCFTCSMRLSRFCCLVHTWRFALRIVLRDFEIQDATASRKWWLINRLGLEHRRLCGKSKVKIPVWMQDNAAAKRRLYQCDSLAFLSQK